MVKTNIVDSSRYKVQVLTDFVKTHSRSSMQNISSVMVLE